MLGLEAERRSLRVSVFGAKSIVTDSKTVTVHLESLDGGTKREVFLWTAPNICEMKAVDWSHSTRSLNHLCDLEIPKPVGHGDVVVYSLGVIIIRNFFYHLNMFQEKRTSVRLLATSTRSMQTLPQKCELMN